VDTVEENNIDEVSEEFAEALSDAAHVEGDFSDEDLYKLATLVLTFSEQLCGIHLYEYQQDAARGVIYSLLREDAEEITMLFSRQSGKTEVLGDLVVGCLVLLPILAAHLNDSRIKKYANGFWVGIFAPNTETATIMYRRMQTRLYSKTAQAILEDPEVDINMPKRSKKVALPNGGFVDCNTAAPGAKIEGKTYHLIICEECQDITDYKIKKSIHPMGAATAATVVKIGTPVPWTCDFEQSCKRNRRSDLGTVGKRMKGIRTHYEFDYKVAMKYNVRYAKYINKEIARLGEDSDEFRMSYRLHWLTERGKFMSDTQFEACGIVEKETLVEEVLDKQRRDRKKVKVTFVRPSYPTTNDRHSLMQVAGVDFGKTNASTVVTVARVWWDNPFVLATPDDDEEERYFVHVQNWLELNGDDYIAQVPQIKNFLQNFNIGMVVCDATGPGDPVTSMLANELEELDVQVEPFVFTAKSKDVGYKILQQEIIAGRFSYPAGSRATKTKKWQKFKQQFLDLEKRWRGALMMVQKPEQDGARDDYPDSAMLCVYGVVHLAEMHREVEQTVNPILGRQARADLAMFQRNTGTVQRVRLKDRANLAESGQRPTTNSRVSQPRQRRARRRW
jgi:hypothetical protein